LGSPSAVTCGVGSMPAGTVTPIPITVKSTSFGTFTATASVIADQPDPNTADNTASTTVRVIGNADMGLAVRAPSQVFVQGSITYSFTIGNSGPDNAGNVIFTDHLASITTLSGWSTSQGSCSSTNEGL